MTKQLFCAVFAGGLALLGLADEVRVRVLAKTDVVDGVQTRKIERVDELRELRSQGWSAVGLSLVEGISCPAGDFEIKGLRLNLLTGRHVNVYGLDVGLLANMADAEALGVSVAGVWNSFGRFGGGWALAGAFNRVRTSGTGIQTALGYNSVDAHMTGVQVALVNAATRLNGVQLGGVNVVVRGSGLQAGLFNRADAFEGLQLGLLNFNGVSAAPCLPVLNFAY